MHPFRVSWFVVRSRIAFARGAIFSHAYPGYVTQSRTAVIHHIHGGYIQCSCTAFTHGGHVRQSRTEAASVSRARRSQTTVAHFMPLPITVFPLLVRSSTPSPCWVLQESLVTASSIFGPSNRVRLSFPASNQVLDHPPPPSAEAECLGDGPLEDPWNVDGRQLL